MSKLSALALAACLVSCSHAQPKEEPAEPTAATPAAPATANPAPATAAEQPAPAAPAAQANSQFKNLQVLPANISKDDLMDSMKAMSRGLGVHCNYCHVVEPTRDFAADTEKKKIARSMMQMTQKINATMFTWPNAPKATCFMCHRGDEHPQFNPPPPAEHPAGATAPQGT